MEKLKNEVKVVRTMNVYSTKNYEHFNISELNRNIKPSNVNVIKNSLLSEGQQKPIVVDNDFYIIDGQHRYTALKELRLPVEFIISNRAGNTVKDKMNVMESQNTSFSWSNMEKLELRSKIDDNYLRLKKLINEYGFGLHSTCHILFNQQIDLQNRKKSGNLSIGFAENTMIITEEMILKSKDRFKNIKELCEINKIFYSSAILKLMTSLIRFQKLDLRTLINKAYKYKNKIEDLNDSNSKLDFIEKLYNYNSKNKTYFIEPTKFYRMKNK